MVGVVHVGGVEAQREHRAVPVGLGHVHRQVHALELAAFCQRSVDEWYTTLARTQVQPDAVYFAEKHMWPDHLPRVAAAVRAEDGVGTACALIETELGRDGAQVTGV